MDVKYCRNCGKQLSDTAVFCGDCGTPAGANEVEQEIKMNQVQVEQVTPSEPVQPITPPVQPVAAPGVNVNVNITQENSSSYFDGGILGWLGWRFLASLLSIVTLGFGTPWAFCFLYKWETSHTVINGKRLKFVGTGGSLFGHWLLWLLLTIVTLGIYGLWLNIKLLQWKTKNTVFDEPLAATNVQMY